MRAAALLSLLIVCGCSREASPGADEAAAVYEAFFFADRSDVPTRVLLQDTEQPVTAGMFSDMEPGARPDISRKYSAEVREAVEDLIARGQTPRRLPAEVEVMHTQSRISADSVAVLLEQIRAHQLHRLPDRSSIVYLSAVGFSRDRSVAVVYHGVVCGWLCGAGMARVVRKHPGGWIAAEELWSVIS